MPHVKRNLANVGINHLPFPLRVISKANKDGQLTIANISINARIMHEFEARWIDRFIQIAHQHRNAIGAESLRYNIINYLDALNAESVMVTFDYPFFIERLTPVAKEKCLVRYQCSYSAKANAENRDSEISFSIRVPVINTDPASEPGEEGGLFGQLSVVTIEVLSKENIYPEDLVEITAKHALSGVYSFLTQEDKIHLIKKIHSESKTSVVMVDEIKNELSRLNNISWFTVKCANFGILNSYNTFIGTEKQARAPYYGYEDWSDIELELLAGSLQ